MGFGEAEGYFGWFNNATALQYSYQAVDAVIQYVQDSGFSESYTIEPINEPVDNPDLSAFGIPAALSESGAAWTSQYIKGALSRIAAANPQIPIMFQGSFKGEPYWSPSFTGTENLVFDVHNYYFAGRPTDSDTDAKASAGDGKFPVFVGEWSIQTASDNKFVNRAINPNTGLYGFGKYTRGSTYWTAKFYGNVPADGEGTQGDYWNYEEFIELGIIDPVEGAGYCD